MTVKHLQIKCYIWNSFENNPGIQADKRKGIGIAATKPAMSW